MSKAVSRRTPATRKRATRKRIDPEQRADPELVLGYPLLLWRLYPAGHDYTGAAGTPPEEAMTRRAVARHGIRPDWWLPPALAVQWRTWIYPNEETAEAVAQWRGPMLALANYRDRHGEKVDDELARLEYDLALLRQYNAGLSGDGATTAPAAGDGESPPWRPPTPTAEYCIVPPNRTRWNGEETVSPSAYRLFEQVLRTRAETIPFDDLKRNVLGNGDMVDKAVRNHISSLSGALGAIAFPWAIGTSKSYLTIDRR